MVADNVGAALGVGHGGLHWGAGLAQVGHKVRHQLRRARDVRPEGVSTHTHTQHRHTQHTQHTTQQTQTQTYTQHTADTDTNTDTDTTHTHTLAVP